MRFEGIIPPLVTPMKDGGELNLDGLPPIVEHVIRGGVHGIFILGSQSESFALSFDEKREIILKTLEIVSGRVPVLVGTGMITTRDSIRMTRLARELGADGVSVMTPYFIRPSQEELYEHYRAIAEEAGEMSVLLYNNPLRTGLQIEVETVVRLAELKNVVGMKESSGDMMRMMRYIQATERMEFDVLSGNDALIYAGMLCGAKGGVSATANVYPDLVVGIYESVRRGNLEEGRRLQYELLKFRVAFNRLGTFPAMVKEAMNMLGLPAGPPRPPVKPLAHEEKEELKRIMDELNLGSGSR
ncbi:TPA: 4-hydroxy-tetrahydrodipicolinate synthase [Candidatus Poribacteria bacterium]|nr:4-hydroxy-tetrahydrodipicolinate synthase [Candidatus Poribacteria bacterium]HEX29476.1 4-hydroxy-tetrahydrodipicolinate synthase [Candidatus Poribacteria bacterium]